MPSPRVRRTETARPSRSRRPRFGSGTRNHLAVLCVVLAASVFGYVLLEPRRVRVEADGREFTVDTSLADDVAVLSLSGVRLREGDRITALDGAGAEVLRVDRAKSVELQADGVTYRLRTHAKTIDELLREAGVTLSERDSVLLDGALVATNAPLVIRPLTRLAAGLRDEGDGSGQRTTIEVKRSVAFTIAEDGRDVLTTSSRPTVAQALREAGVVIGPGDALTPGEQAPLVAGLRIVVRHAKPVTVTLPDGHQVIYTLELSVGAALRAAGIALPPGAFIDPPEDAAVAAGMSVRVVQLSASSDEERESIASGTVYRSDPALAPGATRTEPGHDGVLVRRYDVSYVNGEEVARALIEEYYEVEPLDTVVYYPPQTGRDDAPPAGTATVLRVYATYYTPASAGRDPGDPAYGRTATGDIVTYGIVAVDPDVIPLGTRMFIPGYGYAVAADTGGAVKGYIIDLGYPDGVPIDWRPGWLDIYILS